MSSTAAARTDQTETLLSKADALLPAFIVTGPNAIAIRAGTIFQGREFAKQTDIQLPTEMKAGGDYIIALSSSGSPAADLLAGAPPADAFGGFHYAPGGNASKRAGGDEVPAINPCSVWDCNFRPTCADPRGMACIEGAKRFWCDIYLLGVNHVADGTSKLGVTIADGDDLPENPTPGEKFKRFDYATAVAVIVHHGKQLLSFEEFASAAYGVTEKTAAQRDPKITKLDAPRTSKFGIVQATGNLWSWGHDGDPEEPRASIYGGSWFYDAHAGSRCASVGHWAGSSSGGLSARGRSDHLQLA